MLEPLEERHTHRLDWWGALTLLGWTSLLVFALERGGRDYGWSSPTIVGALGASTALLVAFIAIERRVREPLIPLDLFKIPVLRAANVISVSTGMVMFGVVVVHPALLAGGDRVVGDRRRERAHPDDARHDRRFADRRPHRAQGGLPVAGLGGSRDHDLGRRRAHHAGRRLLPVGHRARDGPDRCRHGPVVHLHHARRAERRGPRADGRRHQLGRTSRVSSVVRSVWQLPRR